MISLSFAGLVGAMIGTLVAAIAYGWLAPFVERGIRAAGSQDRPWSESEISILRRAVLAADIAILGGAGYWLAATIGG